MPHAEQENQAVWAEELSYMDAIQNMNSNEYQMSNIFSFLGNFCHMLRSLY